MDTRNYCKIIYQVQYNVSRRYSVSDTHTFTSFIQFFEEVLLTLHKASQSTPHTLGARRISSERFIGSSVYEIADVIAYVARKCKSLGGTADTSYHELRGDQ